MEVGNVICSGKINEEKSNRSATITAITTLELAFFFSFQWWNHHNIVF
jgi:hypothetical protein